MKSAEKLRTFITIIWVITGIISVIELILGAVLTQRFGAAIFVAIMSVLAGFLITYIIVMFLEVLADLVENTASTTEEIRTGNSYFAQVNARISGAILSFDNEIQQDAPVDPQVSPKKVREQAKNYKNELESFRNDIIKYMNNNKLSPSEKEDLTAQLEQIEDELKKYK